VTSVLQVVDSSGWIEVLTNGPQTDRFFEVLDDEKSLIVPSITVFEVFKWILRGHSEAQAIQAITVMLYACLWQTASSSRLRGNIRLGSSAWMLTSRALQMLNSY
jgi:uncharacterized protein with PIN domain